MMIYINDRCKCCEELLPIARQLAEEIGEDLQVLNVTDDGVEIPDGLNCVPLLVHHGWRWCGSGNLSVIRRSWLRYNETIKTK